jgi:AcrR family transcriptional regulator/DNA-binding MarR family transcriptional regulator
MPEGRSSRDARPVAAANRPWRPGCLAGARDCSVSVAELRRARLLSAALAVVSEHGYTGMTATAVIATAGVSRKTFYELFTDREDCYMALVEHSLTRIAAVVAPAYKDGGAWSQRLRAALVALVAFLEAEPETGALVVSHMVGHGPDSVELRASVRALLIRSLEDGRPPTAVREQLAPLTAEWVVGGALAVIEARLRASPRRLGALVNELMWMITLPYAGPAVAARQLRCRTPARAVPPPSLASDSLRRTSMRLTSRTASTLEAIARVPGASNARVAARAGIADQGQISKLLARLARLGLIENTGAGAASGAANAWWLTVAGRELEAAIRRNLSAAR